MSAWRRAWYGSAGGPGNWAARSDDGMGMGYRR